MAARLQETDVVGNASSMDCRRYVSFGRLGAFANRFRFTAEKMLSTYAPGDTGSVCASAPPLIVQSALPRSTGMTLSAPMTSQMCRLVALAVEHGVGRFCFKNPASTIIFPSRSSSTLYRVGS